jgi:PAS domain S-box-containing protein
MNTNCETTGAPGLELPVEPAEAKLRASELRYRRLFEAARDGILILDLETGRITDVNPFLVELLEFSRDEMVGRTVGELSPFKDIQSNQAMLEQLQQDGYVRYEDLPLETRSGRHIAVEFVSNVYQAGDKKVIQCNVRDITERKAAENVLRESEERYKALFEGSTDCVFLIDFEGHVLDANCASLNLLGYRREQIAGITFSSLLTADQIPLALHLTREIRTTGHQKHPTEYRVRGKDGRLVHVEIIASLICRDGKPFAIQGIARNLTERDRAAADLAASEKNFRELVQHMQIGLVTHGADGRVLFANAMATRLLGLAPDQLINKGVNDPAWRFVREDGTPMPADEFPASRALLAAEGVVTDLILGICQPAVENPVWVQCKSHAIRDREGRIKQAVVTFVDITEQRKNEQALRLLESAVEQSQESIIITDAALALPGPAIVFVNPAFTIMTGYSAQEIIGKTPRILQGPRTDKAVLSRLRQNLEGGEPFAGEAINYRKDGTELNLEWQIAPIRDARGKITHFVGTQRDITERKKLETQLRQSQKMQAIGQLAGGVAHDFNNILADIQMQCELLKISGPISGEQMDFADGIVSAVQRAAALTRQLLLFSSREMFQPHDMDLSESITNTGKMLMRIVGDNIQMRLKLSSEPMLIHADGGMMDQVMLNLAVNARDAMPNGGQLVIETFGVNLDEFAAAHSADLRVGSFVCLSVSDSGCGIPPEIIPKIFEPFFTTKGVGKGTGLGLATVFGIVQQHHGWINVYSELNHGTTFRIYFPRLAKTAGPKSAPPELTAARGGNETILLVEDDPALRFSIQAMLSQLGYHVLEAPNGVKALELWRENRTGIRLLLTDLLMPDGMSGKDLGQRILQECPELQIIYMSGYSAEVVGTGFAVKAGVNFLTKPFQAVELAKTIRNSLDQSVPSDH